MDIVDKVAGTLWGSRMENRGDAHAAAQRLYDAGLLRQPDPPVLTINVRVPTADVQLPTGLVVDTAARPDSAEPDTWTVCFECDGCGAETEVARNEAGWRVLGAAGWSGDLDTHVFCPACTKNGWRTAGLDSEEEQERPPGVIGASCCRCATTGGFPAWGDVLDRVAFAAAGWEVTVADGVARFLCDDCSGRGL